MDDAKIEKLLAQIISTLTDIREGQNKIYRLLNKYDDSYLMEVEKDGMLKEG